MSIRDSSDGSNPNTLEYRADETQFQDCGISFDKLCERIVASGLYDRGQLGQMRDRFPVANTRTFVKQLVSESLLTQYQVNRLLGTADPALVLDRYVLLGEIGAGGMGLVYKALHRQMDRVVAVKVLPDAAMDSEEKVKRFRREVKAAAKLDHPNIVTAFDASEFRGVHFLVMSYVEGRDLAAEIKEHGPVSVSKAVDCIVQAALGLQHAHSMGVVHRDIKPANLLLDINGAVKILDMGLARIDNLSVDDDLTASQDLTHGGMMMGTIGYLAPEQAIDTHHADARSDIYSLGCTLYYLLSGKAVYEEGTAIKTILAHREAEIPSLRDVHNGVPVELDSIYLKMVAKQPEDRFQSMAEVINALESLQIEDSGRLRSVICGRSRNAGVVSGRSEGRLRNRSWLLVAAGLLPVVMLLLALIIKLDTPAGIVVLEIDQPELVGAVVTIDGNKVISIKTGRGTESIEITADERRHALAVEMPGFVTFSKEFSFETGNKQSIKVRLDPRAAIDSTGVAPGISNTSQHIDVMQGGTPRSNLYEVTWRLGGEVWVWDPESRTSVQILPDSNAYSHLAAGPSLKFKDIENFGKEALAQIVDSCTLMPRTVLISIDLSGTSLASEDIGMLAGLPIYGLTLNRIGSMDDTVSQALVQIPNLHSVGLQETNISDSTILAIKSMHSIGELNLSHTAVTSQCIPALCSMKLAKLNVIGTQIDEAGVLTLREALSECVITWSGGVLRPRLTPPAATVESSQLP